MTETPTEPPPKEEGQPTDLDRADQFPEIDESPKPFWVLALQFFLLPMLIALMAVGLYVGVRALTSTQKGIPELIGDIEHGGRNKRWQAAFELSGRLKELKGKVPPEVRNQLILLFDKQINQPVPAGGVTKEDRRLAQYLARCLAYLADPAAAEALKNGLSRDDPQLRLTCIVALGHLQDPESIPDVAQILTAPDPDAAVRTVAAYALGSLARRDAPEKTRKLPGWGERVAQARQALHQAMSQDADRQVRWNAAVALAVTGDKRSVTLLSKLLDVDYVTGVEIKRKDPTSGKLITVSQKLADERARAVEQAARAAGKLGDRSLIPALKKLEGCENKKVRTAALEALRTLEGK